MNNNELYHYGVLGMKWGVRRNPAKAYKKASKKAMKLKSKADNAQIKAGKKTHMHLTDFGAAAEKKAVRKARKAVGKSVKWQKAMDKAFKDIDVSELSKETISSGLEFVKKIS